MEGQSCFLAHSWTGNNEKQKSNLFTHRASVLWDATKDVKEWESGKEEQKMLSNHKTTDCWVTRKGSNLKI